MGNYLRYGCARCGLDLRVGGPEEFYVAPDGHTLTYGHPEASSEEALGRGIDGFWMHLWCAECAATKRIVTMEFATPCDPLDAWSGRGVPKPGYPADATTCPDCAGKLNDEVPGLDAWSPPLAL